MEEFIFGTLATDELKMLYHRAEVRGLHHRYRLQPRDPWPGQPVTLEAIAGPDVSAGRMVCYYTLDGSIPRGERGAALNGHVLEMQPVEVGWDTPLWGYTVRWQAILPGQPDGTIVRYRIGAWDGAGPEVFADWPDVRATTDRAAEAFFHSLPYRDPLLGDPAAGDVFTYRVDRLRPPAWAAGAIIYHIYVDRFDPGPGRGWLQTANLLDFCGGTLWGVLARLDYLQALGITVLWLSPVVESPTPHGYDATDLLRVDARRGGPEALRAVIEEAHRRGMRVLLDLVCNHVSSEHPIFREALANPGSPYRRWFYFDEDTPHGYRAFSGVASMPELNTAHDPVRGWLIEAGRFWLREFGADGFRLDHASGPGPDFWSDFRAACRAENPDCLLIGEVVDTAEVIRHYAGRLDGCLDFLTADALRSTYGRRTWSEQDFTRFLRRHAAFFPDDFLMPTFLDNHDMDRFLFIAGGNREALRQALAAQMRLPGPPVITYGSEIGLRQPESTRGPLGLAASRPVMVWDGAQDRELLDFTREQIATRRQRRAT